MATPKAWPCGPYYRWRESSHQDGKRLSKPDQNARLAKRVQVVLTLCSEKRSRRMSEPRVAYKQEAARRHRAQSQPVISCEVCIDSSIAHPRSSLKTNLPYPCPTLSPTLTEASPSEKSRQRSAFYFCLFPFAFGAVSRRLPRAFRVPLLFLLPFYFFLFTCCLQASLSHARENLQSRH